MHDVVSELVVDESVDMWVKILKDLIFEVLVAALQSCLDVARAVLILAPLCDV